MHHTVSKRRWKLIDSSEPVVLKPVREKTHAEIFSFDNMPEDQKAILQLIKKVVTLFHPEIRLFVYGSRVSGRWIESSDYDILIMGSLTNSELNKIKQIRFGVKTDFRVSPINTIAQVEIK